MIVLSCWLAATSLLPAQDTRYLDSLETEVNRLAGQDSLRLVALTKLWRHTLNSDLERNRSYARQILREARAAGDSSDVAMGHRLLGISLDYAGRIDSSLYHYGEGIALYRQLGNRLQEGTLLYNVANKINALGYPDSALAYLAVADSILAGFPHKKAHSAVNHLASSIERDQGRFHRAIELAVRAFDLAREAGDSLRMADATQQIGLGYLALRDYPAAADYFSRAADYYLLQDDHYYAVDALSKLAFAHGKLADPEPALAAARRAVELTKTHNLDAQRALTQLALGRALLVADRPAAARTALEDAERNSRAGSGGQHRPDILSELSGLALQLNQPEQALRYGREALTLARERKLTETTYVTLGYLATAARRAGQPETAIGYLETRQLYQDSLYQQELGRELAELTVRYERAQQDRKISEQRAQLALLEARTRADRLQKIGLGLGLLLVLSLLAFAYWSLRQRRERHRLERERLGAQLRNQQRELSAHALQMAQKSRLLDDLSGQLREVRGERPGDRKKLDQLLRDLNSEERIDQDWDNFRTYFQGVHGGYLDRLKTVATGKLSPRELRLAALIRMGLSNAEVAPILGVTADTLYKAKYRLRKKFPASAHENVDELLLAV